MAKTVAHTVCTDCKKNFKRLSLDCKVSSVSPAWLWWIANYSVVLHSNSTWIFPRAESISWYFSLIRLFVTTSRRGISTYPNISFTHINTIVTKLTHKNLSIPTWYSQLQIHRSYLKLVTEIVHHLHNLDHKNICQWLSSMTHKASQNVLTPLLLLECRTFGTSHHSRLFITLTNHIILL